MLFLLEGLLRSVKYVIIPTEVKIMRVCQVCGRGTQSGHQISHSHRVSKRKWLVNIQKIRVIVDGTPKRIYVCTRCLRSEKVKKAL